MMHGLGGYGLFGGLGLIGVVINLLLTLALLAGVVLLVIWLARSLGTSRKVSGLDQQARADSTPREILQRRYARGEITRDQYKEMLSDLA
jgi:putative membrane protein